MTEVTRPLTASQNIFGQISLSLRSGAPLHSYRISAGNFLKLENHLRDAVQYRRVDRLGAVFVLWASEKFRRDFAGGAYAWQFLTEPLGLDLPDADMHHLTRRGLAEFGRRVHQNDQGTNFYLKTLAAEGGFPEALLADTEGKTRRMLRSLVSDIERVGRGAPAEVHAQLVSDRVRVLNQGFQSAEYKALLLEFCLGLMELRAAIPDAIPADARNGWLDANRPGWQAELPLRVETAAAKSLLDDVVRAEGGSGSETLAERLLVRVGQAWVPKVAIAKSAEIPDWQLRTDNARLRSLRILPDTELANHAGGLVLSADRSPDNRTWEIQRDSAERRAIFAMPLGRPVTFRLMAEGVAIGVHTPPGGEAIDPDDLPSLWASDDKDTPMAPQQLRRLGSGALKTRAPFIWVLAGSEGAKFDELEYEPDGAVDGVPLYRVTGKGAVYGSGWRLSITTGADEENSDRLLADGPTVTGLRDTQRMEFFQGIPQFRGHGADGIIRSLMAKNLRWRAAGQRDWKNGQKDGLPDPDTCLGLYQFCWRDTAGSARAFTSVRLVPRNARLSILDRGPGKLDCQVNGLPEGTVITLGPNFSGRVPASGALTLRLAETAATLGRVTLHVRPPEGFGRPFDASLPRSGDKGWFADGDDRLLQRDIELDLGMLTGWRVLSPTDREVQLQIRLIGDHTPAHPILQRVSNETSLGSLMARFRGLLAIGGPDSELRLRVLVGATQSPRITLRRHLREGDWQGNALVLNQHSRGITGENLEADVVNLSAPDMGQHLDPFVLGEAFFDDLPEHPGPWMVFAHDRHGLIRPPRPLEKPCETPVSAPRFSESFLACSKAPNRDGRLTAFGRDLRDLTSPMRIGDLMLYERQLDDLGDSMALSSLDAVVALERAPALAALLLLRAPQDRLSKRLDLESVSPFSWTTLPQAAWAQAIKAHRIQACARLVAANFSNKEAEGYASQAIAARLRAIRDRRPEVIGQLAMAAVETNLLPMLDLQQAFPFPPSLSRPEPSLIEAADAAVRGQDGTRPPFVLQSRYAPARFSQYDETLRPILDSPLVAAEHVLGLRPHLPTPETAIALLHYRLQYPDYFEAAMPAAIAYLNPKRT